MRCIECEEIELARVRDERPGQTLPIPYAALDGFPAGRTPSRADAPPAAAVGRRRHRVDLRRASSSAGSRSGSRSPRPPRPPTDKCLVLLYLAGGNDGLNMVLPNGDATRATTARLRRRAPGHPSRLRATRRRRHASAPTPLPGPAARALAFANASCPRTAAATTATRFAHGELRLRHALRRRHRRRGLGPGGHARGRRQASTASATSTTRTSGSRPATTSTTRPAGSAAGSTATATATNPLQAISIDTALSKSIRTTIKPGVRDPVAADDRLHAAIRAAAAARPTRRSTRRSTRLAGARGRRRATPTSTARARPTGSPTTPQRRRRPTRTPRRRRNPTGYPTTATLSRARCRRRRTCSTANLGTRIITIHWGGFDTHTSQLVAQDRQLKELSRALGRVPGGPADPRRSTHRVATLAFSEFGRRVQGDPNGSGRQGRGHRPRRRRPDVRDRHAASAAASRPTGPGCAPSELVPRPTTSGPGQPEGPDGLPLGLQVPCSRSGSATRSRRRCSAAPTDRAAGSR